MFRTVRKVNAFSLPWRKWSNLARFGEDNPMKINSLLFWWWPCNLVPRATLSPTDVLLCVALDTPSAFVMKISRQKRKQRMRQSVMRRIQVHQECCRSPCNAPLKICGQSLNRRRSNYHVRKFICLCWHKRNNINETILHPQLWSETKAGILPQQHPRWKRCFWCTDDWIWEVVYLSNAS